MKQNKVRSGCFLALALLASTSLSACVTNSVPKTSAEMVSSDSWQSGVAALQAGNYAEAREFLSDATARRPNDPLRQTLLALAWSADADASPEAQELALVGFKSALSAQENAFWPALLAGQISLDRGRFSEAQDYFARAVLAEPDAIKAYEGLASAAYQYGDIVMAREAALRAVAIDENSLVGWRLLTLANAAMSDAAGSRSALDQYEVRGGDGAISLRERSNTLLRTVALDDQPMPAGESIYEVDPLRQVSVDVTILLSQTTSRERIGMNLLDGLRLQYSGQGQRTVNNLPGKSNFDAQTSLSQIISIPELTWNMNLFNRFGQHYQVAARPSLTAFLGEASDFFIGRTLQIGVRGIETGQLEQVDIGIRLTVTPIEINEDNVVVRIETGRSFVTTDQAGTFAEALSTFRQEVSATADIAFGTTLVLSGLSETVRDATSSKVPGLGDVPALGSAFNERSTTERKDAVLVLVTPSRPATFKSEPWMRPEGVERLVSLWGDIVDPTTNGQAALQRLSRVRFFRRGQPGDVPSGSSYQSDTQAAMKALLNID